MKYFNIIIAIILVCASYLQVYSQIEIKSRVYYNAKFEPKTKVINGAGQSSEAFENYVKALPETPPVIYMNYLSLRNTDFSNWVQRQDEQIKKYPWVISPQIGLSMTKDGSPEEHYEDKVAAGEFDDQITRLALALKEWKVPCFLRIGYEFNGNWNGYGAESFKISFIKIVEIFRKNNVDNVAFVWCFATDGKAEFMPYYPGDQYVDWWAIDLFGETHFSDPKTIAFLDSALVYKKPVMIGESTPRRVGVQDGNKSWERWFQPYFDLIYQHPQIKAFSYINWNWATYPQWSDWGDGRIETNEIVKEKFEEQLKRSIFLNGGESKKIKKALQIK